MRDFLSKFTTNFLHFQKKYIFLLFVLGIVLSVLTAPRAIKLLTNIKTDLIHLLPQNYPSVHYTDIVKKKFNRRSSLYLIIQSPDKEANQKAMFAVKKYLETVPLVDFIEIEKQGYHFFDQNKLMLIEIGDLYTIHDRLKEKIQKRKLGGLYIDFEGDDNKDDVSFDDFVKKYNDEWAEGARSSYKTNESGTAYILTIYPKGTNSSLKYYKQFGEEIESYASKFDFKKFHPKMTYGYAGAIKTRVDQYDALINDLKKAGVISALSIFLLLYLYFGRFIDRGRTILSYAFSLIMQFVPVLSIFIPMIFSTLIAFWFCSLFFKSLNVVTSFLFAIIFGLGVDLGIHLITRYIQDRCVGKTIDTIHVDVVTKTGKSCAIGILTTVASFYILTINDFKGFSEFGWIAGNGLLIALLCYLLFFPCLLLLIDKYNLLRIRESVFDVTKLDKSRRRWMPYPKFLLGFCVVITLISVVDLKNLHFEWDFDKLKMKIERREYWKQFLKESQGGRVNSPAAYIIENQVQSRKIRQIIRHRKENDKDFQTIQFYRSYYDMIPFDQEEKLAILKKIDVMLQDDALNTVKNDEKQMIKDLREAIAKTKPITEKDIPVDVYDIFWGNAGIKDSSAAYVMPLPHLELDNGNNAKAFYQDVHEVNALGKQFYAVSDSIVFAEVLQTLFRDSKKAIVLSALIILTLVGLHFRNFKETFFISLSLGIGILWMLGFMALFDVKLNFYNMIIIPAMIGMGVDNSVHVVHRFEELEHRSIIAVLKTSGGAALMASLTTILGYSGMCYTSHPGLQSIGYMAIIGMGTCLVASLFFLPLLLQLYLKPGAKKG